MRWAAGIALGLGLASCGGGGDLVKGEGNPRDYLPFCAVGLMQAAPLYRAAAGATYHHGEDPVVRDTDEGPVIACPALSRGREIAVEIRLVCANATEPDCTQVVAVK